MEQQFTFFIERQQYVWFSDVTFSLRYASIHIGFIYSVGKSVFTGKITLMYAA
jgi:hypothetical protein